MTTTQTEIGDGARRRARRVVLLTGVLSAAALIAAAPSASALPGHTSCRAYGELTASEAHAKTIAAELQSLPRGTVDDLIALVHLGGTFGDEIVPPFCTLKEVD